LAGEQEGFGLAQAGLVGLAPPELFQARGQTSPASIPTAGVAPFRLHFHLFIIEMFHSTLLCLS